jgi:transcription initiation factor IIE alpha subunit
MGQSDTIQEIEKTKNKQITYDELLKNLQRNPKTLKDTLIKLQKQKIIKIEKNKIPGKQGNPEWKGSKITLIN